MIKLLDEILLSENAVDKFKENYETNDQFKNWILKILPEVEDCKNLEQDNPWHIYNCLDHILHSVENINELNLDENEDKNARRLLAYTMFLHDIGKPQCKIRRYSKAYKREVDSFFNHNIAGVKIADRVLPSFNFTKEEIEIIKKLIEKHDIFMFITLQDDGNTHHKTLSKKVILDEINELNTLGDGSKLMKYLIRIGYADSLSQNPEMTMDALRLLGVMNTMLDDMVNTTNFNS